MNRLHKTALALASSAVVFCAAPAARAQDAAIAETLYEEGQKLLADGKTAEACEKFAASHRIDPAPGTILNLAACHEKIGKVASAWAEYKEAQALATRKGDQRRADYAAQKVAPLEALLHRVTIAVPAALQDMVVKLDDKPLIREAWGTGIALDPGLHKVEVSAPGYRTWSNAFQVAATPGSEVMQVPPLEVAPATEQPAQTPPPAAAQPAKDEDKPMSPATKRTIGYVVGGAGVVSLGVAAFFGIRAIGKASDRDDLCPSGSPCFKQAAFDADHDARVSQQWMFITGGAGLVLGGVGAWLIFTNPDQPAKAAFTVVPRADSTGAGLTAVGRF